MRMIVLKLPRPLETRKKSEFQAGFEPLSYWRLYGTQLNLLSLTELADELNQTKAPSTRIRFHFKTKLSPYGYGIRPRVSYPMKTITENGTFQKCCFRVYVWTDKNGTFRKR